MEDPYASCLKSSVSVDDFDCKEDDKFFEAFMNLVNPFASYLLEDDCNTRQWKIFSFHGEARGPFSTPELYHIYSKGLINDLITISSTKNPSQPPYQVKTLRKYQKAPKQNANHSVYPPMNIQGNVYKSGVPLEVILPRKTSGDSNDGGAPLHGFA